MNNKKNKKENSGAVTLLAVLIIGFVITVIIISSSLYSRLTIMNSKLLRENYQNKYFSETCVEKALLMIRNDRNYTGNGNFSDGNYECSYLVSNNGTKSRLIQASSTFNGLNYLLEVDISIGNNYITVDSWNRVSGF